MKIHISFDIPNLERALHLAPLIAPFIDGIEIGSILLFQHGIPIINFFKNTCPDKPILADTKLLDRGKAAMSLFMSYQPDWVTVMAGAGNRTIHSTCSAAHEMRIKVMMNLLDSASVGQSAMEAANLGVDALVFHQSYDEEDPLLFMDKWDMVRENTKLPIFISTKVTRQNIHELVLFKPDSIVIAASVFDVKKPEEEARFFYKACHTD